DQLRGRRFLGVPPRHAQGVDLARELAQPLAAVAAFDDLPALAFLMNFDDHSLHGSPPLNHSRRRRESIAELSSVRFIEADGAVAMPTQRTQPKRKTGDARRIAALASPVSTIRPGSGSDRDRDRLVSGVVLALFEPHLRA